MLEKVSCYQRTDEPVLETVVDCEDARSLLIVHVQLTPGQSTPHDKSDADLHFIIVRGTMALRIADQIIHTYAAGSIVAVPFGVMMEARNVGTDPLEFFVIKAPHPAAWLLKKVV